MFEVAEIKDRAGKTDCFTVISPSLPLAPAMRTWNCTIREMAQDLADARNAGDMRDSEEIFIVLGWRSADGRELIDIRAVRSERRSAA